MKAIKRIEIAEVLNYSVGHISDVFNGKKPVGKALAMNIGKITGRRWIEYMDMAPEKIEAELSKVICAQEHVECRAAS